MSDLRDNPIDDLLAAVQRLTDPYHDVKRIVDDNPDGGTDRSVIAKLKRDGLIKQLRNAVVGGIGSHEGAAAGRERIPFDTGALDLYHAMERDITERFVTLTRKPVYLELERTLREWRAAFEDGYAKKHVTDDTLHNAVHAMEGWARKIEAHFDKPKSLEVTIIHKARPDDAPEVKFEDMLCPTKEHRHPAPCPVCGEPFAHNPKTGDKTFALLLEYRELGPDTMDSATGLCRFCDAVWKAGSGMRELAYEIEKAEETLNTPKTA